MKRLPDALFIVDSNNEAIAVKEAKKLGIPVVAVVDTNCDPTVVDYVIPGNDDALRAIRLFASKISDAVLVGRQAYEQTQIAENKSAADAAGEDGVDYVDTSAYEVYEKQEGDFVEGEPTAETAEVAVAETMPSEEASVRYGSGDDGGQR
jgi:small subunit ribosomal protein S2